MNGEKGSRRAQFQVPAKLEPCVCSTLCFFFQELEPFQKKIFFCFGYAPQLVGSQFSDQGLNLGLEVVKARILTTRPPQDSLRVVFLNTKA